MEACQAKRNKIWIVANTTWYIFNFRGRLIEELRKAGYSITALSPTDSYVEHLERLGATHIHLDMDNAGTNPLREGVLLLRLFQLLSANRPRLILTFTPKLNIYSSFVARLAGIPVVANVSGLGSGFIRGGWLASVIKALYRVALRHPRTVFFQNADDERLFLAEGLVPPRRAKRLPGSGVDVDRFAPRERAGHEGPFVFLMVARLLRDKGVYEYVEAARAMRATGHHAQFRLLGIFDSRNPTAISRKEAARWQAEGVIRFLQAADDVRPHYADADCVVLPSYREGCPRTLLEAASMAKPIIATDVPGCRQVLDDGSTGFLVRLADADDLKAKMIRMLSLTPQQRFDMGARGREKMVQEFDERLVIQRYGDAIAEALHASNDR